MASKLHFRPSTLSKSDQQEEHRGLQNRKWNRRCIYRNMNQQNSFHRKIRIRNHHFLGSNSNEREKWVGFRGYQLSGCLTPLKYSAHSSYEETPRFLNCIIEEVKDSNYSTHTTPQRNSDLFNSNENYNVPKSVKDSLVDGLNDINDNKFPTIPTDSNSIASSIEEVSQGLAGMKLVNSAQCHRRKIQKNHIRQFLHRNKISHFEVSNNSYIITPYINHNKTDRYHEWMWAHKGKQNHQIRFTIVPERVTYDDRDLIAETTGSSHNQTSLINTNIS